MFLGSKKYSGTVLKLAVFEFRARVIDFWLARTVENDL
jgi:hypothetical protein